jgi:hypothetical protein
MTSTIALHGSGGGMSKPLINSNRIVKIRTFNLDITSYSTGGEDISSVVNEFAGASPLAVIGVASAATPGAVYTYDPATKKLKAWWSGTASATLNEVTAATDLNLVTVIAFGY